MPAVGKVAHAFHVDGLVVQHGLAAVQVLDELGDAAAVVEFVGLDRIGTFVGELDGDKLAPLLKLKYRNAIADATTDLGRPDEIRGLFIAPPA